MPIQHFSYYITVYISGEKIVSSCLRRWYKLKENVLMFQQNTQCCLFDLIQLEGLKANKEGEPSSSK